MKNEMNLKETRILNLQVIRSAAGKSPMIPIGTLNDASAIYREFIESNGFGASEAGQCLITRGNEVVAHVSYNGKVWAGKPSFEARELLFQP